VSNYLLVLSESELRAVDRVLCALTHSNHPVVAREIDEALGTLLTADLRRGLAHIHGALLSQNVEHDHDEGCRCDACMDDAFGSLSEFPPDIEGQRDAVYGDLGVPTVGDSRD
jgi:hypothetical protein